MYQILHLVSSIMEFINILLMYDLNVSKLTESAACKTSVPLFYVSLRWDRIMCVCARARVCVCVQDVNKA